MRSGRSARQARGDHPPDRFDGDQPEEAGRRQLGAVRQGVDLGQPDSDALDDSVREGTFPENVRPKTIADGLMTTLGTLTWPIVRDVVDAMYTVDEDTIRTTTRLFWERTKLIIEPPTDNRRPTCSSRPPVAVHRCVSPSRSV